MSATLPTRQRPADPSRGRPAARRTAWLVVLLGVIAVAVVGSVALGSRLVPPGDVVGALLDPDPDSLTDAVVRERLPRTVLGLVVGAALGVSGAVLQGITRNPLADPGILGINTGAALAVVTGIAFFGVATLDAYIWLGILGAGVTAVFVYLIGSLGRGGATPLKLALAGAATTAALSSLVSAILLPRIEIMNTFRFWQIGGIGAATWDGILSVAPFLVLGGLLSVGAARGLNTLALGEDLAAGLGEQVARARAVAGLGAILLCGAATAVSGPIAFVGLVIPHLVRQLVGVDHRLILPYSALAGSALLLVADIVGRVVARPSGIEVGVMTAIIGAPFFIAIVRRSRVREL